MNISADVDLEDCGLLDSTLVKSWFATYSKELKSLDLKTLQINQPPFLSTSVAILRAWRASSIWLYASVFQLEPTFGAPSFKTISALKCFSSFFIYDKHFYVVISEIKVTHPFIGGIGSKSTPILIEAIGMYLAQTWSLY